MSLTLRILLIVGSLATACFFLIKIRKSKMQIEDSVFWFAFSFATIVLSIFPQILAFFGKLLGIQSNVNLLFLVMIFILLLRIFMLTIKVSAMENKIKTMAQNMAIKETNEHKKNG